MVRRGLELDLPCGGTLNLRNIILDLNGTLALDGEILEGAQRKLIELAAKMDVYILTADTNQTADDLHIQHAHIQIHKLETDCGDVQKLEFLTRLGRSETAAIGNGKNDVLMLKESAVGICVIGREGASTDALQNSDIIIYDIRDALDLFLKPNRIIATLRE